MVRTKVGSIDVFIVLIQSIQSTIAQMTFEYEKRTTKYEEIIAQSVRRYGLVSKDQWFESQ